MSDVGSSEERVLICTPTGRDAALTRQFLSGAGIGSTVCEDIPALCREVPRGAGAALVAEEALSSAAYSEFDKLLESQPPWSDLPLVIFTSEAAPAEWVQDAARRLAQRWNATLLDRPLRKLALLTAVRASLRARRRQYEVRELLRQLQEGVRHRDEFLAMLGHELRNPLAAIVTSIELMSRDSDADLARQRTVIARQTRVLSRLVDDLLDVSRVTSGKISLQRVPLDLVDLVGRCVQSVSVSADARRIDLRLESGPGRLGVVGDPTRLEQVVTNLLTNALKYTPEGGKIEVLLSAADGRACVRVRDTGVGIPPEILPGIFDLFQQAERTLDRAQGGLGIGLTLARSLIDLHGGSISAKSEGLGRGAEFSFGLPLAQNALPPDRRRQDRSQQRTRRARRRVLIVEDNPDQRTGLEELLSSLGHEVATAGDGIEGLRRATELHPDIALIDIGLPGLDGYSLARRIRETLGADVFLIALTGYGQPDDRRRALDAGFDEHLTKPAHLPALTALLDRARPRTASASSSVS